MMVRGDADNRVLHFDGSFHDLSPSEDTFDATTFTKNRRRLVKLGLAKALLRAKPVH